MQTDRPSPPSLQALAAALDSAERADATLRPRHGGAFTQPPAPYEADYTAFAWLPPKHPAVRDYWRALKQSMRHHVYGEDTLRRCRARHRKAWNVYSDLTTRRDSGFFIGEGVTLRAILDARAELVESHMILVQVENSTTYKRKIEAARARELADEIKLRNAQLLVRQLKKAIHDRQPD